MGEDNAWTYLGAQEGNIPQQIISRHFQTNAITYFVKVKILKNKDNRWTYLGTVSAFFTDLKYTDPQIPQLQKRSKREILPTFAGH